MFRTKHRQHWDSVAQYHERMHKPGRHYHRPLDEIFQFLVPQGQRVLEIGCGQGDLLAAMKPSLGVGVDISAEMLRRAAQRHPQLRFIQADGHELALEQKFDFIILSDLVDDLWDVQLLFRKLSALTTPSSRLIINSASRLWQLPLTIARKMRWAEPRLTQSWLTPPDIINLLHVEGFEVIRHWQEIICPLPLPILAAPANRYLARLWFFRHLALTNFVLARPGGVQVNEEPEPSVSVIVPARNESGNIKALLARIPQMGSRTEVIFVEGHSKDGTYETIQQAIARETKVDARLFRQTGVGKGDAVRLGFERSSGDMVMILDADMSVPPEDLTRFYEALRSRRGEFINGSRLVYPMEEQAMRPLNFLGNKVFSLIFSWLLGQPIKDTLCGTKALWKRDYDLIAANRSYFGDFDPFGDFDLLLGAAKLNLKIVEVPIRYRRRVYGTTNIQRWKHGWLLLRMSFFAAAKLKFH